MIFLFEANIILISRRYYLDENSKRIYLIAIYLPGNDHNKYRKRNGKSKEFINKNFMPTIIQQCYLDNI